jgi:dTDP-4-dehydrorhamnose reductase
VNIFLFGASGMLGFALHRKLHDLGFNVTGSLRGDAKAGTRWTSGLHYVNGVCIEDFDTAARALDRCRPDVVINATGVRSLGSVNGDWLTLLAVNSAFPRRLGQLCDSRGIYFVHFSSDGVFSGSRGHYDESALPDATDAYGVSKYLGEVHTGTSLVLRTSLLGRGLVRNESLVDWFLAQTGVVRGFRRSVFSGLPVHEIAEVMQRILTAQSRLTGLYHLAADPITKFDVLTLLRSTWSHPAEIVPDDSAMLDRTLDATLLNSRIGYRPPSWAELIAEMHAFYERLESRQ